MHLLQSWSPANPDGPQGTQDPQITGQWCGVCQRPMFGSSGDTRPHSAGVQAFRFGSTDQEVKGGSGSEGGRKGCIGLAHAQKMGPDTSCDRC